MNFRKRDFKRPKLKHTQYTSIQTSLRRIFTGNSFFKQSVKSVAIEVGNIFVLAIIIMTYLLSWYICYMLYDIYKLLKR